MKKEKRKKEMPVSQRKNLEYYLEQQKLKNNQIKVFFDIFRID
ncbi:MAG: hypothetical protein PHD83_03995 [Caldisericia bacterium]|nr:hypothetical protein [Caldisericia bacterium]